MDIPLNTEVKCADGTNARSVCIIINPIQKDVTHVVIEMKGLLGMTYMVPVDQISSSTSHQIQLKCTREQMAKMAPFTHSEFIGPEDSEYNHYQPTTFGYEGDESYLWPYAGHDDVGMYIDVEQVPYGELGIHRGSHVEATDGHIGHVGEFIVNPENEHITHLVLREGHLWGKREVTIPISEIKRMKDNVVYLKLNKKQVQEIPSVPIKRWWSNK